MSQTWWSELPPPDPETGPGRTLRAILRAVPLALLVFGGLALLLLVRLVERPLCGMRRPVTPWITQGVCRGALSLIGLGYVVEGRPMARPGAVVANHSSWLDIFALNACQRIYFVSKEEVRGWPGIGWLARATGTVFIARDRRRAGEQVGQFEARLRLGHRLAFFPEGTSTDGRRVLPFKPTLFAAFLAPGLPADLAIQPVSVIHEAPAGSDPRIYGWWGDMAFGPHLLATLGARRQGRVRVIFHPAIPVAEMPERKALARAAEASVRAGLTGAGVTTG